MYEYDEECLQAFLEQQGKLFDEPVADTLEEAEAFLEDCMAAVVNNIEEVKEFLEEELTKKENGKIIAENIVYPGVKMTISSVSNSIKSEVQHSAFVRDGADIRIRAI